MNRRFLLVTLATATWIFSSTVPACFASDPMPDTAAANQAKNLARLNCGAHIERILPGGRVTSFSANTDPTINPAALMLEDNTLSCPLVSGDNVFVVTLPRISLLQRFAFINRNSLAQGEFELAVSNYRLGSTDPKWIKVQNATSFNNARMINASLPGVEARYVRVTFHVRKEGNLAALSLYGTSTLNNFARGHAFKAQTMYSIGTVSAAATLFDVLNYNCANEYASARVVYVSSAGDASPSRMIDDDASTSFQFASEDAHPTIVVELGNQQRLRRISTVCDMPQGVVDFYLMDELPQDHGDLSHARFVGSVAHEEGDGNLSLNFAPQKANYLALRWRSKVKTKAKISVADIAAFGDLPLSVVELGETPNQEFSNTLGTLRMPSIPSISP